MASPRLGNAPEPSGRLTHGRPEQRWNPPECQVPSSRVTGHGCSDGPTSRRIGRTCHSLIGIMKSKHSRRMVPITRSQKAFACGARTGVFRILRPIASSVRSTRLQPSVSRPRTSLRLGALAQESINRLRNPSNTAWDAATHREHATCGLSPINLSASS